MPSYYVTAQLSDAHDGLTRLLGDIARFGCDLESVSLLGGSTEDCWVDLSFQGRAQDLDNLSWRLGRHLSVGTVSTKVELN